MLDGPVGRRIGRYYVLRKLGSGGMGAVYVGHDPRLNREVALKVLPPVTESSPDARRRFEAEAQAVAALRHPNIVTVFEFGEEDGAPFIAMELLPGVSLADAIRDRTAITTDDKLRMTGEICLALQQAHDRGIVHRDVKPANIWIEPTGLVKLLDFGIAKQADFGLTMTGQTVGTPAYIAPEICAGQSADARSDVFALGVTLYEWLTFEKPFRAADSAQLLWKILHEDPPPIQQYVPGLSMEVSGIVSQALAKNPELRYQTTVAMKRDLDRARGRMVAATELITPIGSPAGTTAVAQPHATQRSRRVHPFAIVGICVSLALLALLVGPRFVTTQPHVLMARSLTVPNLGLVDTARSGRIASGRTVEAGAAPREESVSTEREDAQPTVSTASASAPVAREADVVIPAAPPEILVPIGTPVFASLVDDLNTDRAQVGDAFRAVLDEPIAVHSHEFAAAGTTMSGRIVGLSRQRGQLFVELALTEMVLDGKRITLRTNVYRVVAPTAGGAPTLSTLIIGAIGGAGAGALSGGKQGAAVGAAAAALATERSPGRTVAVVSGIHLAFKLAEPLNALDR
jgi:Protein kinase domain